MGQDSYWNPVRARTGKDGLSCRSRVCGGAPLLCRDKVLREAGRASNTPTALLPSDLLLGPPTGQQEASWPGSLEDAVLKGQHAGGTKQGRKRRMGMDWGRDDTDTR